MLALVTDEGAPDDRAIAVQPQEEVWKRLDQCSKLGPGLKQLA